MLVPPGCASTGSRESGDAAAPALGHPRKLIEFGWDEPDAGFMRRHLAELEATPFDGCVYHLNPMEPGRPAGNFTWNAWGTRTYTEADLQPGLDDLMATPFKRFRWNFLRLNVTPGVDWFDDYGAVLANARLAATVVRRSHSAGIMFDTEPYQLEMFRYAAQRDARTRSFAEYAAQARVRGAEVMRAFEQGYPGLTVFLTYGPSTPWIQWRGSRIRLEDGRFGLLPAFVDGMISAASDSARIVDGNEASYPERSPAALDAYMEAMTNGVLPWLSDPARYRQRISRSFGIWLDHDWRHRPWDVRNPKKSYRPPDALRAVVRRALTLADDYVWVYSEKARWWTESGTRQDLPEAYVQALRAARKGLTP